MSDVGNQITRITQLTINIDEKMIKFFVPPTPHREAIRKVTNLVKETETKNEKK
jgi:hypothetical protein